MEGIDRSCCPERHRSGADVVKGGISFVQSGDNPLHLSGIKLDDVL